MKNKYNPAILLLAVSLLCFSIVGSSYAFFRKGDIDTAFVLNQELGKLSSVSNKGKIGVYDNFHQPFETTHGKNNFLPLSKNFVEVDSIKNIIYSQHYGRSAFSGDTKLSNLLYANLKFKMLTDEYMALQREAFTIIDDYAVSFFDFGLEKYHRGFPIESIHRKREILFNDQRATLKDIGLSSSKLSGTIEIAQLRSTESPLAVMNIRDDVKTQKREDFDSYNVVPYDTKASPGMLHKKNRNEVQNGENSPGTWRRNGSAGDTQLPWLFRVFFSLIQYCYENKIETVIYWVIFMLAVGIFSKSQSG